MNYFLCLGDVEIGGTPLGTDGKLIIRDLKTLRGVINRGKRAWPGKTFTVWSFRNFYREDTFRKVHTNIGDMA
jgi:hypothetical protein